MVHSPYTSYPVALSIGPEHRTYYVPQDFLQNLDLTDSCRSWDGNIQLPDVDESTGHVLVHYLYTGRYQTLNDTEMSLVPEAITEFKRAVLAYTAANKYGLFGLQQLAKDKIEYFGAEINIFDVVEAIKGGFSTLLCDDQWFYSYLGGKAETAFEEDHTVFAGENFFDRINDVALAKVMAKCVVELYNIKVSRMLNTEREPVPGSSEECTLDVQDSPVEEAQAQEAFTIQETPSEECPAPELSTETHPTQHYPIGDIPVQEPTIQEASIEELATAEERPPEANRWGFYFGSAAQWNQKCVTTIIDESVTEPTPEKEEGLWSMNEPKVDELPIAAPEPEPVLPVDEGRGTVAVASKKEKKKKKEKIKERKMKKKAKKCAEDPPLPPEEPSPPLTEPEPEPAPAEEIKNNDQSNWSPAPVVDATTIVQEADGTVVSTSNSDRKEEVDQPIEVDGDLCPFRANHLLSDDWKNCSSCRGILHQVAIQIARASHADEDGYVVVDEILMN